MSSQGSPSRTFASPSRHVSTTSNRSHPYSRPANTPSHNDNAQSKSIMTSRGFTRSATGLPRSGSEPTGLISGLRSLISKPFSWLATPKRGHSPDPEDGDVDMSPTDSSRGQTKRIRRKSPSPTPGARGDYEPESRRRGTMEVTGRAVTGHMIRSNEIPALPTNMSLSKRPNGIPRSGNTTNFSRPLASSQSMPYLDPPTGASPSRSKRNGAVTRSRRNLAQEAEEEEDSSMEDRGMLISPPRRGATPTRRDFGLPSNSPFRSTGVNGSPSRFGAASLSRSNTMGNLNRAPSVAATDVSMASSHRRGESTVFGQHPVTPSGRQDSRMSVDGSAADWFMRDTSKQAGLTPGRAAAMRNGSIAPNAAFPPIRRGPLVWDSDRGFIRESELRAENPAPVGANEAERILFALENRRNTPLQSARSSAVPFSQGGPFPAELVGASSRQIRKAINVPLATAQSRETLKSKMEKELKADRERGVSVLISPYARRKAAEEELRAARAAERMEREKEERERALSEQRERELSVPISQGRLSRRTRSVSSGLSDAGMDQDDPVTTPRRSARLQRSTQGEETTPKRKEKGKSKAESARKRSSRQGSPPTETPRRSTRKRTAERATSPDAPPPIPSVPTITETAPSPQEKTTSSYRPRADGEMARGKSSLRAHADKRRTHEGAASYEGSRANTPGSGSFSARDEDLPDMDELDENAKIPLNSFSGISFTPFTSAPASPAPEIPTTSAPADAASADSSSLLGRLGPKPAETSLNVPVRGGPLSRIDKHRPRASSPLAGSSTVAEPESPPAPAPTATPAPTTGFVPLFNPATGSTTPAGKLPATTTFGGFSSTSKDAPPASSLFGNLEPAKKAAGTGLGLGKPSEPAKASSGDSIPDFFGKSQPPSGSTTPTPAPVTSFNFGATAPPAPTVAPPIVGSTPADTAKPASASTFTFGASANGDKPPTSFFAPKPAEAKASTPASTNATAPPSFFSTPSAPPQQAEKPAEASKFSFAPKTDTPTVDEPKSNPFSFGAPAAKTAEPAKAPAFSFGQSTTLKPDAASQAPKPSVEPKPLFSFPAAPATAESAPKTTFSFGAPAAAAPTSGTSTPAQPPFSFGASAATPAKAEEAKTGSLFGASTNSVPTSTEPPKTTFTFGQPAQNDKPASPFGASTPAASPAPATSGFGNSTSAPFGGFSFNKPAETATSATSAPGTPNGTSTGFSFGTNNNTSSGFGTTNNATSGFGSTANKTSGANGFGNVTSPSTAAQPSFTFGGTQNTTSSGFGSNTSSGFGSAAPAAPASNPFGSSSNPSSSTPSSTFNFAAGNNTSTPSSNPFGAAATPASPAPATNGGGGFAFTFGQPSATGNAPSAPSTPFTFGASAPSSNTNTTTFGGSNSSNGGFGAPAPSSGFGSQPASASSFGGGFNSTPANGSFGSAMNFGAPASTPGVNTASQPFVFGAPNGVPGSPAAGGGFSLGTGAPAPGSPSGRAIKPLRKKR